MKIRKIKGEYFVDSIWLSMMVEKKLSSPLPVEIIDSPDMMRDPPCCICGSQDRKDIFIACVGGDWKRRICETCIEKHMPDLMPILKKKIKEGYAERKRGGKNRRRTQR